MSAHTCKTLNDDCYRCDLGRDEMRAIQEEIRREAEAAWLAYRDGPMRFRSPKQLRRREFIAGYLAANDMEVTR